MKLSARWKAGADSWREGEYGGRVVVLTVYHPVTASLSRGRWLRPEEELALFFIRHREPWNQLAGRKGLDIPDSRRRASLLM